MTKMMEIREYDKKKNHEGPILYVNPLTVLTISGGLTGNAIIELINGKKILIYGGSIWASEYLSKCLSRDV